MKSEPKNLGRKTPLPQSQISDTSLNGAGDGTGYQSSYQEVVADHPVYNASAGLPNNMITSRGLNSNDTAGVISTPSFGGGMPDNVASASGVDVTNSETNGTANPSFSEADGGSKWERPHAQDIPAKGRNQYDTPQ